MAEAAGPIVAPARVCVVEIVSGPSGGEYVVKIKKREPDGTWADQSSLTFTLIDLNA